MSSNNLTFEEQMEIDAAKTRIEKAIEALLLPGGVVGYDAVTGKPVRSDPVIDVRVEHAAYDAALKRAGLLDLNIIAEHINTINSAGYNDADVSIARDALANLITDWQSKGFVGTDVTIDTFLSGQDNAQLLNEVREKFRTAAIEEYKSTVRVEAESAFSVEEAAFRDSIAQARGPYAFRSGGIDEIKAKIDEWKNSGIITPEAADKFTQMIDSEEIKNVSSDAAIDALLADAKKNSGDIAITLAAGEIAAVDVKAIADFDAVSAGLQNNVSIVNNDVVTDAQRDAAVIALGDMMSNYNSARQNESGFAPITDYSVLLDQAQADDAALNAAANNEKLVSANRDIEYLKRLLIGDGTRILTDEQLLKLAAGGPADFEKILQGLAAGDKPYIHEGIIKGFVYRYAYSSNEDTFEEIMNEQVWYSSSYEFDENDPLNVAIDRLAGGGVARYLKILIHSSSEFNGTVEGLEAALNNLPSYTNEYGDVQRSVDPRFIEDLLKVYEDERSQALHGIGKYAPSSAAAQEVQENEGLVDADVSTSLSTPATGNASLNGNSAGVGVS